MKWERYTTVVGNKESIDVQHLEDRLFRFRHPSLATNSNVHGEFSTTKMEDAVRLAKHIAQNGGLE